MLQRFIELLYTFARSCCLASAGGEPINRGRLRTRAVSSQTGEAIPDHPEFCSTAGERGKRRQIRFFSLNISAFFDDGERIFGFCLVNLPAFVREKFSLCNIFNQPKVGTNISNVKVQTKRITFIH